MHGRDRRACLLCFHRAEPPMVSGLVEMTDLRPGWLGAGAGATPTERRLELCFPTLSTRTFGSSTQTRKCQLFRQQRVKSTRISVFLSRAREIRGVFRCVLIIVNKLRDKNLTV